MSNTELYDHVAALLQDHPDGILPIVQAGRPVLRQPAAHYDGQLGELLPEFLHALHVTMMDAPGVGVAATQVGVPLAIAVMWDPGSLDEDDTRERVAFDSRVVINPTYMPVSDDKVSFYEGCLSVDGYQAVVARYRSVRLQAHDEHGNPLDEVLHGWPARIVQHETDHLNGVLYIDKADIRSLTSTENLVDLWASSSEPVDAARELGFALAQHSALKD
ncbi:peptide deformylase [Timonella sp. A28]|uniref:peptide deformylase n=1 Tax=Timonella sp. A28 TaxID=3442640 RepID=UPI003EBB8AEF